MPIHLTSVETDSRISRLHASALWGGADSARSGVSFFSEVCGIGTGWGGRLIQCRLSADHRLPRGASVPSSAGKKLSVGPPRLRSRRNAPCSSTVQFFAVLQPSCNVRPAQVQDGHQDDFQQRGSARSVRRMEFGSRGLRLASRAPTGKRPSSKIELK
jgi:hypothetical protein